jgi:hypothetical protein
MCRSNYCLDLGGRVPKYVQNRIISAISFFLSKPNSWLIWRAWWSRIFSGSVAGLAILALDDSSRRRTLSLYLLARLAQVSNNLALVTFLYEPARSSCCTTWSLQCAYNSAKSKNRFHFWGSHWRHGDALLFSLASAQVTKWNWCLS